jgi:hypothetical protein
LKETPEVVMPVDVSLRVKFNIAEYLHADDSEDEEQH